MFHVGGNTLRHLTSGADEVAGDLPSYVISQWHCEKDTEIQGLVLGLILDLEYTLLDVGNTTFIFQQMRTTEDFSWYRVVRCDLLPTSHMGLFRLAGLFRGSISRIVCWVIMNILTHL